MYHAGTPEIVKQHILNDITNNLGNIKVVVCTIAFGMGVNCHGVHRVVHFGPSKCIESYLQECGRGGRDNENCYCHLLYNGFLQTHCDIDIKQYIRADDCRRKNLLSIFPGKYSHAEEISQCQCCDVCMEKYAIECKEDKLNFLNKDNGEGINLRRRIVSEENKELVIEKLNQYKDEIQGSVVSPCKLYTEFTEYHVNQVVKSLEVILSYLTLKQHVEIWRNKHACKVLTILNDVFNDIDPEEIDGLSLNNSGLSLQDEENEEW